jgi:hypothetical protein
LKGGKNQYKNSDRKPYTRFRKSLIVESYEAADQNLVWYTLRDASELSHSISRGEARMYAGEGTFFYQPGGTPHGFRAMGTKSVRITYCTIPAGFDGFVIEHSRPVTVSEDMVSQGKLKIEVLGSYSK